MPINRSPPSTPTPTSSLLAPLKTPLHHSCSEPDITKTDQLVSIESELLNVTHRGSKRKCIESGSSQDIDLSLFMSEMKTMFLEFKEQQNSKIEQLCATVEEIKIQNSNIQSTVNFLSQNYDDLKIKLLTMESRLETERKNNLAHLKTLEDKLESLERGVRSSCVEIRNIPISKSETKEGLLNTVVKMGTTLNVPILPLQIKDVFRIGSQDSDTRTVIVDFTSNLLKEKFIQMFRKYNKEHNKLSTEDLKISGPAKPIYVSENLSPKMKRLFFLARDFASTNKYRYCWIKNGKIFIREKDGAHHIMIKDESDLPKE